MNPLAAVGDSCHLFASSSKKPVTVFIPGAFHTPAHFGPLSRYLETQGCESFCISLPSIGSKAGTRHGGLAEDVAAIRGVLEELIWGADREDGKGKDEHVQRGAGGNDVVLVMHSSGAVSGCQAVASLERSHRVKEGKRGGVVGLIFIGGLLVDEGESLESTVLALGEGVLPEYAGVENPILPPSNAGSTLFSDLPPEKATYWESQLEPQSASVYTTAVRNTCWDLDIPTTYVVCTKDHQAGVRNAMLTKMARGTWKIKMIDAGHSPFLSHVEKLGDLILKAGRKLR